MSQERTTTRWGLVAALLLGALLSAMGWLRPRGEPVPAEAPTTSEHLEPRDAPAQEPEVEAAQGPFEVECELADDPGDLPRLVLKELDPDSLALLATHEPRLDGRFFTFRATGMDGLGVLSSRAHEPKPLAWVAGTCTTLVELERIPSRTVSGVVEGPLEVGAVAVHAECGSTGPADFSGSLSADGGFRLEIPEGGECSLVVSRVFGGRDLEGDPVDLPGTTGDLEDLVLDVPKAPGLGMGLFPVDGGLRVYGVDPGSPAAAAGLRLLDLVVAVDEEPAEELDLELVLTDTSPMRLDIVREGERLELSVGP